MPKPKLSSKTPDDPKYNSLIGSHDTILRMPRERRYAIVELRTKGINTDVATGDQQATEVVVHIEEPPSGAEQAKLEKLLDDWYNRRNKEPRGNPAGDEDTPLDGLGLDGGDGGEV